MAGIIYCFNVVADYKIYKAGHTRQESLSCRLRSYLGPSKPRTIVASRAVADSVVAEKLMLALLRQSTALRARNDLGDEWFEVRSETENMEECHRAIRLVLDVVAMAVSEHPMGRAIQPSTVAPMPHEDTAWKQDERCCQVKPHDTAVVASTLPSMGSYFAALDRYVSRNPVLANTVDDIVVTFEQSDDCPVFPEYVLFNRETRLSTARARYPHLASP